MTRNRKTKLKYATSSDDALRTAKIPDRHSEGYEDGFDKLFIEDDGRGEDVPYGNITTLPPDAHAVRVKSQIEKFYERYPDWDKWSVDTF